MKNYFKDGKWNKDAARVIRNTHVWERAGLSKGVLYPKAGALPKRIRSDPCAPVCSAAVAGGGGAQDLLRI